MSDHTPAPARLQHNSAQCPPGAAVNGAIRSEEADDYHAIVAILNDHWRVIVCRAGIQWILQRRAGERRGRARWASRSYCRTKEGLTLFSHEHAGEIEPAALAILAALPARIDDLAPSAEVVPAR